MDDEGHVAIFNPVNTFFLLRTTTSMSCSVYSYRGVCVFEAFIQVIFLLFNVGPILLSRKPWFVGGGRRRGHLCGQEVFVKRNLYKTVAETQVLYFNLKAIEKGEGTEGQIDHLQRPDGWGKRPVIFLLLLLFFSTRTYAKARRASPGQRTGDDPLAPRLPHNPFVSVLIAPTQEDEGDEEEEEEEAQHGQIVSAPSASARGRKEEEEENRRSSFSSPGPCCKGSHSMCAVCIIVLSKRGPRTRSPMHVRHRVGLFRALPPCCATPGSKFGLHSPRL